MRKILIIEDDPVMGFVCQRLLSKGGYEIEIANDGCKGLECVNSFQPDLILLDLMMPKMNGLEVLKNLRAQESLHNLPIIVMTNACVPTMVEQATAAGATHILDKSKFNPVSITELLRSMLEGGSPSRLPAISQNEYVKRLN
jgi:CheY-like chemotaxis protein